MRRPQWAPAAARLRARRLSSLERLDIRERATQTMASVLQCNGGRLLGVLIASARAFCCRVEGRKVGGKTETIADAFVFSSQPALQTRPVSHVTLIVQLETLSSLGTLVLFAEEPRRDSVATSFCIVNARTCCSVAGRCRVMRRTRQKTSLPCRAGLA